MATKYEIRLKGAQFASGLTLKQAANSPVMTHAGVSVHGTDGHEYVVRGAGKARTLVRVDSVTAPLSDAKLARVAAAMERQAETARILERNPSAFGEGSDDDAIEDLGLGTRDGGLFGA